MLVALGSAARVKIAISQYRDNVGNTLTRNVGRQIFPLSILPKNGQ
jgi:hypothetical protein